MINILSVCQYKKYRMLAKKCENKSKWNPINNQVPETFWLHLEVGHI